MKDFVSYLLKPFIQDTDKVIINVEDLEDGQTEVVVQVPVEDMGRIIGKKGKTVASLRQIMRLYGHIHSQQVLFKVEERENESVD